MKVLVAEDDEYIREGLVDILEGEGYTVVEAVDGNEAIHKFNEEKPDFVCLDIMMPHKNGYDVCREIRQKCPQTPVVFLSAKSEEIDKVIGLELGADDYIVKPFGIKEVIARIRAVTRRCLVKPQKEILSFHMQGIEVFPETLHIKRDEQSTEVSLRDIRILQFFVKYEGRVQSRNQIFKECWGMTNCENTRTLDQKISQLRKIIEKDPQNPTIIKTVHGAGYIYSL